MTMLRGAGERFLPIPEGYEGSLTTLQHMRRIILEAQDDPLVIIVARGLVGRSPEVIFETVRRAMLYYPDVNDGVVVDEVRTPGYLLRDVLTHGTALGDCDDYVVLLGALYHALGYPVKLVAISRSEDRQLDHVYLMIATDDGWTAADGIVSHPFGWEVDAREQVSREELPV